MDIISALITNTRIALYKTKKEGLYVGGLKGPDGKKLTFFYRERTGGQSNNGKRLPDAEISFSISDDDYQKPQQQGQQQANANPQHGSSDEIPF